MDEFEQSLINDIIEKLIMLISYADGKHLANDIQNLNLKIISPEKKDKTKE